MLTGMTTSTAGNFKVRENRLRRMLARRGYQLVKNRARDPRALGYGKYMIMNLSDNREAAGGLDLDAVEQWVRRTDMEFPEMHFPPNKEAAEFRAHLMKWTTANGTSC
jgi:hypothetical protein